MTLTIEQAREKRRKGEVIFPVYNVLTGNLVKVFSWAGEAFKFADSKANYRYSNICNNIHCPREIYLMLTPNAQLDFYLDRILEDDITRKHDRLRIEIANKTMIDKLALGIPTSDK